MSALPERAILRAVAEVIVGQEKAREAADRDVLSELARLRERIDEYGNVIRQPGPVGERGLAWRGWRRGACG